VYNNIPARVEPVLTPRPGKAQLNSAFLIIRPVSFTRVYRQSTKDAVSYFLSAGCKEPVILKEQMREMFILPLLDGILGCFFIF
jgi:hypothetical protein